MDPRSVQWRRSLLRFNGLFVPPRTNENGRSPEVFESCATSIRIVRIESDVVDVSLRAAGRVERDSWNSGGRVTSHPQERLRLFVGVVSVADRDVRLALSDVRARDGGGGSRSRTERGGVLPPSRGLKGMVFNQISDVCYAFGQNRFVAW